MDFEAMIRDAQKNRLTIDNIAKNKDKSDNEKIADFLREIGL